MENLNSLSITQPPEQLHQCDRSSVVVSCTIAGIFSSATVEFTVMRNGAIESAFTKTVTAPVKSGTKNYAVVLDFSRFGSTKGESLAVAVKATVGSKIYSKTKSVVIFHPNTCLKFTKVSTGGAVSTPSTDKTGFSSSSDISKRTTFTVQRVSGTRISTLDWYLDRRREDGTIASEKIARGSTADT